MTRQNIADICARNKKLMYAHHQPWPSKENTAANDNIVGSWRKVFYEGLLITTCTSLLYLDSFMAVLGLFFHLLHIVSFLLSPFASLGTHCCRI